MRQGLVLRSLLVAVAALSVSAIGKNVSIQPVRASDVFPRLQVDKLIVMPSADGHADWINAIKNAQRSIQMEMYHLTDRAVIDALASRAQDRNLEIRVIVDGKLTGGYKKAFEAVQAAGVNIRASSQFFSITHTKAMVIDGQTAFVTAINMTNTAQNTRDFGIVTSDEGVIAELDRVFEADWQNSQTGGGDTPELSDANLAWAPVDAAPKLIQLVDLATNSLDIEVENLGSDDVMNAFVRAAQRGVNVRLIVPECVFGNAKFNYQFFPRLSGVQIHVEHNGNSIAQPYMHSKMMEVDGKYVYVGSINFSMNSTLHAREVGIIFENEDTAGSLNQEFEKDWNRSQVPAAQPACGGKESDDHFGSSGNF